MELKFSDITLSLQKFPTVSFLSSGIVCCCRKYQPFIHSIVNTSLSGVFNGLDTNPGAGVTRRQNLCPHRDHFLAEKDKNRRVGTMPVWLKQVRHRSVPVLWPLKLDSAKVLTLARGAKRGTEEESRGQEITGKPFSGKEKVQIQFPHPLYSPSPPPSKQANFGH